MNCSQGNQQCRGRRGTQGSHHPETRRPMPMPYTQLRPYSQPMHQPAPRVHRMHHHLPRHQAHLQAPTRTHSGPSLALPHDQAHEA